MSAAATNLHFHGLAVPPLCHQDETLRTLIEPGDPTFLYRIRIPADQPPGLYWYHPHVHGFSETHLLGGASGALIVEGIENSVPSVKGLPERVLVVRDEWMPPQSSADKPDPNRPTKQLSLNYVPIAYPEYPPPVIQMRPHQRELWRMLNASADTYISVYLEVGGKRRNIGLVALDGAPLRYGETSGTEYIPENPSIFLPPGARAEFIVTAPADGESGRLMTAYVYRGADEEAPPASRTAAQPGVRAGQDDVDAARPLAVITVASNAPLPEAVQPARAATHLSAPALSGVPAVRKRTLYFSERLANPSDPNSQQLFFLTEDGHEPRVFDPNSTEPTLTLRQGDVEDWVVENRSREVHTFHIHQLHFLVINRRHAGWEEPSLRDTVNVPAWSGFGSYPRLTLRMDFRDPTLVGVLPFHCHIAQHLDGGMMGTVRVVPSGATK